MIRVLIHQKVADVMANIFESLKKYFDRLKSTGYVKQSEVNKLLVYTFIHDMINNDFRGYLNSEDYGILSKALYCLYGTTCLIPYPDYYNNKDKKIMFTGSLSELACRVQKLEDTKDHCYIQTTDDQSVDITEMKATLESIENKLDRKVLIGVKRTDFNNDGYVNDVDRSILTQVVASGSQDLKYDANLDGSVNVGDWEVAIEEVNESD